MPQKLTPAQWRELNAELIPRVADWIGRYDEVLTVRGRKFAERAMAKANLAGEAGTRTLFEPVLLVSLADPAAETSELLEVCDRIPFTGDYFQWDYIRAIYAATYRHQVKRGDVDSAANSLRMISYPENGEQPEDPFASGLPAVGNRANGAVLGQSVAYPRPATTNPALQHLLGAVREWNIIWAYGISETWTRARIDTELEVARTNATAFIP